MCNTMMKTVIFLSISMIVYSEDNYHEATQKAILAPSINPSINSPIISPTLRIPIDNLSYMKLDTYASDSTCGPSTIKQTDYYQLTACIHYSSTINIMYTHNPFGRTFTTQYYKADSMCTVPSGAAVTVKTYSSTCSPNGIVGSVVFVTPSFTNALPGDTTKGTLIAYHPYTEDCSTSTLPVAWYSYIPNYSCLDAAQTACSGPLPADSGTTAYSYSKSTYGLSSTCSGTPKTTIVTSNSCIVSPNSFSYYLSCVK